MNNKVIVHEVKEAPAIGKPEMMGDIRSKEAAGFWAIKNGYMVVYWWRARERVYADKLTKAVDVLAKQVETKSGRLLEMAENGGALLEVILLIALVAFVLWALGKYCGAPW